MPHLNLGRVGPAQAPVSVSKVPVDFVFKMRIPENGLENHFVRQRRVCVELHQPRMPTHEILDIGAGIVR